MRPFIRRTQLMMVCTSALVFTTAAIAAAQSTTLLQVQQQIASANESLDAGAFARAESTYAEVLKSAAWLPAPIRASANFGRSLAAQHGLASTDSSRLAERLSLIRQGYDSAIADDPTLRDDAETNLALLLRSIGDHRGAAERFRRAAQASPAEARGALLIEGAIAAEAAEDPAAAAAFYREAIAAGERSVPAVGGLLRTLAARGSANEMLAAAERWMADTTHAASVVQGLADFLARETGRPSPSEARKGLGYLARALTNARMGPSAFGATMPAKLAVVEARRSDIARGVRALRDVYRERRADASFVEGDDASWWHQVDRERAAWSALLRWMGDWYSQRNATRLAASYYEAAIGREAAYVTSQWADRKALAPLALIYAESGSGGTGELQRNVDDFIERLFAKKGVAYGQNDLETIRVLHTALGTYYASKGQWSGSDARNAEFQLSRMRTVTESLARQGKRVTDPPELLARLAAHYEDTGRRDSAEVLKRQVRTHYEVRQRPEKANELFIKARLPMVRTPEVTRVPTRPSADTTRARPTVPVRSDTVPAAAGRQPTRAVAASAAVVMARQSVGGTVVDAGTRRAIKDVKVMLIVRGDTTTVSTDDGGKFTASLPASATSARIVVSASRYEEQSADVTLERAIAISLKRTAAGRVNRPAAVVRPPR